MAGGEPIRRLTTIVAADVAGYSQLTASDEEGTLAALRAHRTELIDPTIAEYRGRIANTAGDSLLIEFPSVVDALRCAMDIQSAMASRNRWIAEDRRIEFRVGINLGDVIEQDGDLLGDGVNVAARLEGLAESGGICISARVWEDVRDRLDIGFQDQGEQRLKNIAHPVRVYRVLLDGAASETVAAPPRPKPWQAWAATAVVVLAVLAGGLWWWQPWLNRLDLPPPSVAVGGKPETASAATTSDKAALPLPDKPSIAVLPFQNLSEDKAQEYFADGMAEDVITDLSKLSGLFVIARNSSFVHKGRQVDVKQVARDLGVKYVLEGSVRRAGDQVRINAQLIDAATGGHLWAERYDGTLDDVFALQDRITGKIVEALALHFTADEEQRLAARGTDNPAAYDSFLKGWDHYVKRTPEGFAKAIPHFEQAIALDPIYGMAHAALASIYWEGGSQRFWYEKFGLFWGETRTRAKEHLEQALKYPTPLAHRVASLTYLDQWAGRQRQVPAKQDFDQALSEAQKAIALDPNDPEGHIAMAHVLTMSGRPSEALAFVEAAMRLNPNYPSDYQFEGAFAHFGMDEFEKSANLLEQALERNPQDLFASFLLPPTYALLEREQQ